MKSNRLPFGFVLVSLAVFCASVAPAASEQKLKSGAPLAVDVDAGLPRVTLVITFPGGPGIIPVELQGLAFVLKEMLDEGPLGMSSAAFRDSLFLSNGEIEFSPTRLALDVIVKAPPDRLKDVLGLLAQVVSRPKLDEETFRNAKAKVTESVAARFDNMRNVVFYYGFRDAVQNHPFTLDGHGSPRSVNNVTLAKVKEYLPLLLKGQEAMFTAVGPAEPRVVAEAIEQSLGLNPGFGRYSESDRVFASPETFKRKKLVVKIIDRPGATDNQILFVYPEKLQMDGPEAAVGDVAYALLGDGSSGRLGKALRTERGLTYFAGTRVTSMGWSVYTFGGVEQTPKLLAGVPEIIKAFRKETFSDVEVREMKESKLTDFKTSVELPLDRLKAKLSLVLRGLNPSFVDQYENYLNKTNTKDVQDFVKMKTVTDGGYLYLMGDSKNLIKALSEVGISKDSVTVVADSDIL